ncbi:MAG: AAA family ATPase [Candidatus Rokubacteria bacterium]|nr:AAA family ATPase [Candidatus Rokubacteria bacterium]
MITRLVVEGYKSLRRVELRNLSRLVLLYGPNASGKSNLLDALDLLGHLSRGTWPLRSTWISINRSVTS